MNKYGVRHGLRYAGTVLSHPIQGFYDMRFENKGNIVSCFILLALMISAFIFQRQYTGFIFSTTNPKWFNVLREVVNVVVPVLLWCAANWSITVLMDGEGRFADIFMATCYASVPYTVCAFLGVLATRFMSLEEAMFVGILNGLGMFFTAVLLFSGIMTIHQYSVSKTVATIIITLSGMAFIAFLTLLFAGMMDNLIRYVLGIITEIQLRM